MIPAGTYKAVGTVAALGYTKSGTEQIGVSFRIIEGEEAGQSLTWYGYFSEKAQNMAMKALRACGWQGDDVGELAGEDFGRLCPNAVDIVVIHDTYEGKTSAKIDFVNVPGVAMQNQMSPAQRSKFGANLRKLAAETPKQPQVAGEVGGGRIPF